MSRFLDNYDAVVTNGPALEKWLKARGVQIDAGMPLSIERGHFSPARATRSCAPPCSPNASCRPRGNCLFGLGRHHPKKRWRLVIDAVERAGSSLPVGLMLLGAGIESHTIEKRIAGSPHIRMFRPVYDRERLAGSWRAATR